MKKEQLLKNTVAGIMALGISVAAGEVMAAKKGFEKCAGVVKKGMNDCGNSRHSCSGQAAKDGMVDEWLFVPNGTCEKIVGAKLFVKKK